MAKPPIAKKYFPLVTSRYEDFVALHANATGGGIRLDTVFSDPRRIRNSSSQGIHGVPIFLPWHRYMIWEWETVIRDECGWPEGQPYWDWHLDAPDAGGAWLTSPLFDPVYGFGGNGARINFTAMAGRGGNTPPLSAGNATITSSPTSQGRRPPPPGTSPAIPQQFNTSRPNFAFGFRNGTGGGCISDGPFKDIKLHIGPMGAMIPNNTRCLTRNFDPTIVPVGASRASMQRVLSSKNFGEFRLAVESGNFSFGRDEHSGEFHITARTPAFHNVGHGGVGGEMQDGFTSTNDPIFFLHHGGIDRMWTIWQDLDLQNRLSDVAETPRTLAPQMPAFPGFENLPLNFTLPTALTLDTAIVLGFQAPDRPVKDVMDTLNRDGKGFLCYKYDKGAEVYL